MRLQLRADSCRRFSSPLAREAFLLTQVYLRVYLYYLSDCIAPIAAISQIKPATSNEPPFREVFFLSPRKKNKKSYFLS
jgi:hypothetical protein